MSKVKGDLAKPLIEEGKKAAPAPKVEGASIISFKFNVFLAMRVSGMIVVCSLPVFIPAWHDAILETVWGPYLAYIPGGTNMMIVFTVFGNFGGTLQLFWQGGMGTAGACMWIYVMSALMPNGAGGEHYYAPLAHFANVSFVVIVMWLNLSKNVRMFILSYHVYFAMEFMNPATPKGTYNTSWAPAMGSEATVTMLTAIAGLIGALGVMLIPAPIMAKRAASASAISAAGAVCGLMDELVEYYSRSSPSVVIAQKEVEAIALRGSVATMQANIDASWWETFDIVSGGMRRMLLGRHVLLLETLCDNMFAMQICMSKEDFGKTHVICMEKIAAPIKALMDATRDLLVTATNAAADGLISEGEKADLEADIAKTKAAITELGRAFNRTRKAMFPDKVINPDLQAESFFVYCLSAYARHVLEYTFLMVRKPPVKNSFVKEVCDAGKDIFNRKVLMSRLDVHAFTIRGSLSILGSYYLGMYWVPFNAVASGTIALLISDFAGSALQKNLGRIQAVVIGAVVPHILYMVMGTVCDPSLIVVRMVVLFLFETITCYIYYASPTYGFIGCLSAAFALTSLVYPCGPTPDAAAEQAFGITSFVKMTQTTIGVIFMTCIDMVLATERASDGASKNLLKGLMTIDMWFQSAFLERQPEGALEAAAAATGVKCRADIADDHDTAKDVVRSFHGKRQPGTILGHMGLAQALGNEADLEPRYQRGAWPTEFFNAQCRKALILRANLAVVEHVLMGTRRQGVDCYSDFARIRSTKAWKDVQNDITDTMGSCIEMIQAILSNETGKSMPHVQNKLVELEGADKIESMPDLFKAINGAGMKYPADADLKTLEDDEICRLNVLLMLFDSNIENIADMLKECLKMI